jgi:hypothetical protein
MYHIKFLLITIVSLIRLVHAGLRVEHTNFVLCEFYRFYWRQVDVGEDHGISNDYVIIEDMADIDYSSKGYSTLLRGRHRRLGVAEDN